MAYTQRDFGVELLVEVERGYDVVRLSRWAMSLYMDRCQEMDEVLTQRVMSIVAMEEGPEFEFSEEELREMAKEASATNKACQ